MCTVSYVYSSGKVIITSNRDEKTERPSSVKPQQYCLNNKKINFPKDPKAGGTWFALDEHANVAVLLNGSDKKHMPQGSYLKSRGLILLDIISSKSPIEEWKTIALHAIEPFTIVLLEGNTLFQLRWNGVEKETTPLSAEQNHIWSSSTLYSLEIRKQREEWFTEFTTDKSIISENDMQYFHLNTDKDDTENGLVINRNDIVKTFSVTQTVIEKNKINMFHFDLHSKEEYANSFLII